MIRAYIRSNKYFEALEIYRLLLEKKIEPDKYTFTFVLKACAGNLDLEEGVLVHHDIVDKGLDCDVYIGTSLINMYCKLGDLDCAKLVFDKMPEKDVTAWNAMIFGFSEGLDPLKAFDLFSNMQLKSGVRPNSVSLLNLFPAVSKFQNIKLCKVLHGYITRRDFSRAVFNGLIDIYLKCGSSNTGRLVFDLMRDHDDVSWGTIMAGYAHNGCSLQVLELFNEMKEKNRTINKVSIAGSLLAAAELRDLEKGKEIHECATEQGIDRDILVATPLMTMYAKCGELEKAKKLFTDFREKDVVAWSAAIAVFCQSGYPEEALLLFQEMIKNNFRPNKVTLVSVLPACAELTFLKLGKSLHCYAIKFNIDMDVLTGTALVSLYAKCQLFTQAIRVFQRLDQRDVVTWNALISGYAQSSEAFRAIEVFNELRMYGFKSDSGTVIGVLPAYALIGDLNQCNCMYGLIVKSGFDSQCQVKNALVDMFTKCGSLPSAESLFHEIEFIKDEVSWNVMIAGYADNGHAKKAIFAFTQMRLEALQPNLITIISVLPAIAYLSDVKEGIKVHAYIIHMGFQSSTLVMNSLISMYAKCGHTEFSEIIFTEIRNRGLVTWNALLSGYAVQGQGDHAIALFSLMQRRHVEVDHVSFISVLSACRHTGLVDEGREIFSSMIEVYGLDPHLEHYACMVDLFSRVGLFDEALRIIENMPMEPDASVWGAVLSSSKMHSNATLGELAIEHLAKLEPQNPAHYVVSSSLFSQCSRWVDAKDTRVKMNETGLKKTPGLLPYSDTINGDYGICKVMVETQGYACEEHTVTTKDGYILSLQRIPSGRSGTKADKPPVLVQHGIMIDAISWIVNVPDEALPYILADNGYDVWLANTRGTKYSSGHTSLNTNDAAYWDWSWDELAAYDLPGFIEYVNTQTGNKLHYVGHSLGTLMALAALSQDNILDMEMLRSVALLSPIAYMGQMPGQIYKLAADAFLAEDVYWLGLNEFIPGEGAATKLIADICIDTHSNCSNLMTLVTGNSCCVNSSIIEVLLEHEPQPTSTKNMVHLAQMIRKGTIAMFDYGNDDDNNKHYGQPTPPPYDMASIPKDVPLFLAYGGQDKLSDFKDVHTLLGSLQDHNPDKLVTLFKEEYAHTDFVLATNANRLVYDPLMAFFKLN